MKTISLEEKRDMPEPIVGDSEESYCPTVYISGIKDAALADLPPEGLITFRFKRRTSTTNDQDETYGAELELKSIEDAVGEKMADKKTSTETSVADGLDDEEAKIKGPKIEIDVEEEND